MTLRASLLRELEKPNLSVDRRADLCCQLAREREYRGEYERARKLLSDYWSRIGERPKVDGLHPNIAAEVLLCVGVLTGIIGSKNQISGAEETARDLISESRTIFESRRNGKKIAEAEIELALCYWRTGQNNEAESGRVKYFAAALSPSVTERKAVEPFLEAMESRLVDQLFWSQYCCCVEALITDRLPHHGIVLLVVGPSLP